MVLASSSAEIDILAQFLLVAGIAALADLPIAIFLAALLARRRFAAIFDLPLVLAGFGLLMIFGDDGAVAEAVPAAILMVLPFPLRQIRRSIEAIDPGLETAARMLGAGPFDRFGSITLPLIVPGILSGAVLAFVMGFCGLALAEWIAAHA